MRKINFFFNLIALCFSVGFFISCSNDNEVGATQELASDISTYLKSSYGQNVRMGESVNVKIGTASALSKSASGKIYTVTEVFVGAETDAHAYEVADNATHTALFFVDINRDNYTAKIVDYKTSNVIKLVDVNLSPDYAGTKGFDLIKVITDPGHIDPPSNQTLDWHYTYGPPYPYQGKCYRQVFRQYFVLGIAFTKELIVLDPRSSNGLALAIPCDTTYEEWIKTQPK
ncbi:hypothetical protein [Flavobacterium psychrotrophum]|uniref:hypothetical protein n=1 Tax=Flavobacterium psychrotrophum TaxID=2294119 RepID=UPI000E31638B|nr:hypothetical protein [Flavobacterium psychrotrophum]